MIDISLLNVLFDDDAMIRKYLLVFRDDVPVSLHELSDYIHRNDWENASITAHSLKSQLQYLKEEEVANLAYEIELLCEDPSQSNQVTLLHNVEILKKEMLLIFKNIENYLAQF